MELEVTPTFPTFIGRVQLPDADAMNRGLRALILGEEAEYASLGRSNVGGWHSRPDFLHQSDPKAVGRAPGWLGQAENEPVPVVQNELAPRACRSAVRSG